MKRPEPLTPELRSLIEAAMSVNSANWSDAEQFAKEHRTDLFISHARVNKLLVAAKLIAAACAIVTLEAGGYQKLS